MVEKKSNTCSKTHLYLVLIGKGKGHIDVIHPMFWKRSGKEPLSVYPSIVDIREGWKLLEAVDSSRPLFVDISGEVWGWPWCLSNLVLWFAGGVVGNGLRQFD
jgi:hypothetical protein